MNAEVTHELYKYHKPLYESPMIIKIPTGDGMVIALIDAANPNQVLFFDAAYQEYVGMDEIESNIAPFEKSKQHSIGTIDW